MQIWNVLHAARCKIQDAKIAKNSPSERHRTTLSGYILATKALIDNQKKTVKQRYLSHMFPQCGVLRPTSEWDRSDSLGHPSQFQRVSRLGSVTARHCSSGRQPNFAVLNRGRHVYSTGRPSRWALAHILVDICVHSVEDSTMILIFDLIYFSLFIMVAKIQLLGLVFLSVTYLPVLGYDATLSNWLYCINKWSK